MFDGVKWQRPHAGFLKCNCDATIFEREGYTGLGCMLRDSHNVPIADPFVTTTNPYFFLNFFFTKVTPLTFGSDINPKLSSGHNSTSALQ